MKIYKNNENFGETFTKRLKNLIFFIRLEFTLTSDLWKRDSPGQPGQDSQERTVRVGF
jgi:hypothetical protein